MKLIITGATGFIGAEVLRQALARPDVTSVVALSRKPLTGPESQNPKLKTILIEDFTKYPDSVLSELAGAQGCAWTLGLARPDDMDAYRRINVEFTTAGVDAFAKYLAPKLPAGQKFRFLYLSGMMAVRDQNKSLWFLQEGRRVRGQGENEVLAAQDKFEDRLETFVYRPAFVIGKDSGLLHGAIGSTYSIKVDHLAAAILEGTINGSEKQVVECQDIVELGKKVVKG